MSMMGELQFFLGLQIKQSKEGTFVHQAKYTKDIVRKFKIEDSKAMTTQLVFECGGDDELGEEIFQEEEHELGDDEDGSVVPPAEHVPTTSTTVVDGPSPTPMTANQDREEATVEGEVASRREPPR
jgi:hypothetical protein